jgi:hypothetical protein
MSAELMRSYLDILNEQQQPQHLDEGVIDTIMTKIKPLAKKAMSMLGQDAVKEIAAKAQQATGGNLSLTKDNALKVAAALGLDARSIAKQQNKDAVQEGIAGNWQGKLIQLAYTLIGPGSLIGGAIVGPQNAAAYAAMIIGAISLLFAGVFYSSAPGQVGAMGKFGNQGTDARKGLDDTGQIKTGQKSFMGTPD